MEKSVYIQNQLQNCRTYFAAANTHAGFKSFFDKIFDPLALETVYILKGGPGVGKSTLMKKVTALALEKGFNPVCYLCSSDPSSLDGVVLEELGVAVVDGTSPHACEPKYAGVKEIIVNMGECWDIPKLKQVGVDVLSLSAKKSAMYRAAYKYLDAENQICGCLREITEVCLLCDKLCSDVSRRTKKLFGKSALSTAGKESVAITAANSTKGTLRLDTFIRQAEKVCFVKDFCGISENYFHELYRQSKEYSTDVLVSYSPSDTCVIDGLYFPQTRVCFVPYDDNAALEFDRNAIGYTVINTKRFCDVEKFSQNRAYYRFGEKCRVVMHDEALEYLKKAGDFHGALEKLYSGCTDYQKVSSLTQLLLNKVLK